MASDDPLLRWFEPRFAGTVASWVRDADELFNLTPTTPPSLTAKKVIAWTQTAGRPFMLLQRGVRVPCGYAELNSMRLNEECLWIGHVIVDPAVRGRGIGRTFVRMLVDRGFSMLGAQRISLIVFPDNEPAIRCYVDAGFQLRGEEYHRFGRARRRHRMLRFEVDRPKVYRPPSLVVAQGLPGDRRVWPVS